MIKRTGFPPGAEREITEVLGIRVVDRDGRIWVGPKFPQDQMARAIYYSRMGGFVPPEVAVDTILTNPLHYGAGGFEGIRAVRTRYGDGFVELPSNIARLVFSSLAFNLSLVNQTKALLEDPNIEHVEHLQRIPREFFADSERAVREGDEIKMGVTIFRKDGSTEKVTVPFRLKVRFDNEEKVFSLKEMEAAICSLAFLNDLVREGEFSADQLEIILGGYFRPFFWVSGEEGLRVQTLFRREKGSPLLDKPLYFAIATLHWGLYLDDKGYREGLDVLIAPLPRIDESMPVTQKIAGNYVNCARNVNIAMRLGFGEILVTNHKGEIVEGSAENIVVLMTNKRTGEMVAYCPPLSSNILAGTNRDRVLRILEQGLEVSGKKVKLVMKAPKKKAMIDVLAGDSVWEVSAVVMMGTGVGIIHIRSITDNPALKDWMGCNELRSEESEATPLFLRRISETEKKYLVNNGQRHPFVDALKKAYDEFVLAENGRRITPAYCMDYEALERVLGVGMDEFANREFRHKVGACHFNERIDGLKHPEEIHSRTREVAAALRRAIDISYQRRCKGRYPELALRR